MIKIEEEDLDAIFKNVIIFIRLLQNRKIEFTEEENKIVQEIQEDIENHSQLRSLMSMRKFIFDLYKQAEIASINNVSAASETAAKVYQEYLICTKEVEKQKEIIVQKRIARKKRMEELLSNLLCEEKRSMKGE